MAAHEEAMLRFHGDNDVDGEDVSVAHAGGVPGIAPLENDVVEVGQVLDLIYRVQRPAAIRRTRRARSASTRPAVSTQRNSTASSIDGEQEVRRPSKLVAPVEPEAPSGLEVSLIEVEGPAAPAGLDELELRTEDMVATAAAQVEEPEEFRPVGLLQMTDPDVAAPPTLRESLVPEAIFAPRPRPGVVIFALVTGVLIAMFAFMVNVMTPT